ncbi:MAG TPA: GNAT family N-acetyltransferase [Niabella sp.]|jgi:N-acetylglutamate synthase-like GNAT family acetyltransferase|nr:GNAT family N-acetyltransferase [Chitinophagaceae bacterium]HRN47847.1 GNAT family N-acetyltransferase [Niabella sp.]HRO84446.1 GNAT family N-acetyltransferase [Niabella sp.]HRQ52303.1 GNAT family N-acetyltransferase [Agriterribacter sp.]
MEINIRRAEAKDCERILELVQELAIYERASNEVTVSLEHFTESGFGKNPVWWAFVAETPVSDMANEEENKNSIVGIALYYIRFSTWKGQVLYLEDIIVTQEMRGQHIGTILFERILQEAKEKGFKRVAWQVLDWNEPAINFYKKYNATFDGEWINCTVVL